MSASPPSRLSFRLLIARHVCQLWGLQADETERLLGVPTSASVRDPLTPEQQQRVLLVIAVCDTVDQLCPGAEEADAWMSKPQLAFGGCSALATILQSSDGLAQVYRYALSCLEKAHDSRAAGAGARAAAAQRQESCHDR